MPHAPSVVVLFFALLPAMASCSAPAPSGASGAQAGGSRVDISTPKALQQTEQPSPQPVNQTQDQLADAQHAAPRATPRASEKAPERWWVATPKPVEGVLRVIASGRAPRLIDARQLAVDNAHDLLARSLGFTPEDATIERAAAEQADGFYTAWVLISAPSAP